MRASRYFIPTLRSAPAEAQVISHQLMLRAGMIQQVASGIYAWLPLGLRVLRKIAAVIDAEQVKIDSHVMEAPTIQPADLWRESGRYDDYGKEMLRIQDRGGRDLLYGPTAEEVFTHIARAHVKSYKDLPLRLYNLQWKFRDEIRPRFGVMRGREFLMKDAYSFDIDIESARESYFAMFASYLAIFKRLGVRALALGADTGPIGGDFSHEFHLIAGKGESALYYDSALEDVPLDNPEALTKYYAAADEKHDPAACSVPAERLKTARGIEVGHIFLFGDKYSSPMKAQVTDKSGKNVPVQMGSYGIGVGRLAAALIEVSHDDRGIIWPEAAAPFDLHLLCLQPQDNACRQACDKLYADLTDAGYEVLYDERALAPGPKFADADLIGLPRQIVISNRGLAEGRAEIIERATGQKQHVPLETVVEAVAP